MALRLYGNIWHAYFRDENGRLRTLSTHETDKAAAAKIDRKIRAMIRVQKSRKVMLEFMPPEMREKAIQAGVESNILPLHKKNRLKLSDMFELAGKYRKLSVTHQRAWERFTSSINVKYAEEVTPQIALEYLKQNFGHGNGKSFNNHKTYLNTIFKLCLVDGNLSSSPFENVMNMRLTNTENHRPLTQNEFVSLFKAAREPWKTAMLISWHTGMRKSDCFTLRWIDIHSDYIEKIPQKTSRFKRSVYIPLHPELKSHLEKFCPTNKRKPSEMVFSEYFPNGYKEMPGNEQRYIMNLFSSCEVESDKNGKASFHSIRASFVTRCEQAGIPRSAIRSMVGHTTDTMTDTYSQDRETPKKILSLPSVCENVCESD